MISTRGRYAIRFMIDLAEQSEEFPVPLEDIVETCSAGTDRIAEGWFHTLEINAVPCLSEPETSIQKTYHWLQAIDAR